mgnify:CR=1 FL=1
MTTLLTAEPAHPTVTRTLHRLRHTYRPHGWTIWHGQSTGQYWAAHTHTMVLLSSTNETDLAHAIHRFGPAPRPATTPDRLANPRRYSQGNSPSATAPPGWISPLKAPRAAPHSSKTATDTFPRSSAHRS